MTASDVIVAMETLPDAEIDTILGGERPLILAPHADDESLGCGGFIAACCERGRQPVVAHTHRRCCVPSGLKAISAGAVAATSEEEARQAVAALGLASENLVFFNYPDTALPSSQAVSERLAILARDRGCTVMLAPWLYDPHCDHEAAAILAREAARRARCRLLSYPVWGWLLPPDHPLPVTQVAGYKLPIAAHLQAKRSAVAAHASQYSTLIDDSPNGFRLPPELLSVFERPYEVFLAHE